MHMCSHQHVSQNKHPHLAVVTELDRLVKEADNKRAKKKTDKQFSARGRVESIPSQLPVPVSAPDWEYKADWVMPSSDDVGDSPSASTAPITELTSITSQIPVKAENNMETDFFQVMSFHHQTLSNA